VSSLLFRSSGGLVFLVVLAGCVYRGKPVTVIPSGGGAAVGVGATRGWAIKEVVQKNPPSGEQRKTAALKKRR